MSFQLKYPYLSIDITFGSLIYMSSRILSPTGSCAHRRIANNRSTIFRSIIRSRNDPSCALQAPGPCIQNYLAFHKETTPNQLSIHSMSLQRVAQEFCFWRFFRRTSAAIDAAKVQYFAVHGSNARHTPWASPSGVDSAARSQ